MTPTPSPRTAAGQSFRERYGDEPMQTDAKDTCAHADAQLLYIGAALDEWYCRDCTQTVRVWSL